MLEMRYTREVCTNVEANPMVRQCLIVKKISSVSGVVNITLSVTLEPPKSDVTLMLQRGSPTYLACLGLVAL